VQTPLTVMNCPSKRRSILYPNNASGGTVANNAGGITSGKVARCDYAICAGDQDKTEFWAGPSGSDADTIATFYWDWMNGIGPCSGVCFECSQVRIGDVQDGPSNQILIGERAINSDNYTDGQAEKATMYAGMCNDMFRTTFTGLPSSLGSVKNPVRDDRALPSGPAELRSFGSPHDAGCNFVFCDGSVRRLSFNIDPLTFSNLGNRKDGGTIKWEEIMK
jgi:prepilin-type processing-associated H-X9-DG protein